MSFDLYLLHRRCAKGLIFVEMQKPSRAGAKERQKAIAKRQEKGEEEKTSKQKAVRSKKR